MQKLRRYLNPSALESPFSYLEIKCDWWEVRPWSGSPRKGSWLELDDCEAAITDLMADLEMRIKDLEPYDEDTDNESDGNGNAIVKEVPSRTVNPDPEGKRRQYIDRALRELSSAPSEPREAAPLFRRLTECNGFATLRGGLDALGYR
jgi:hypothetical protein